MKKILLLTIPVFVLTLTSCSSWVNGSKPLSDKALSDNQINAKIIDGQSTIESVDSIFGKRDTGRALTHKTFPEGKKSIAVYHGNFNSFGATYAHRKLYVAYGDDNKIINHDVVINDFRKENAFEKDPVNSKNLAFSDINKGDGKEKVVSLLGEPKDITFSDEGSLLWVYANTDISRDASSYIPLYSLAKGTESGISERLYIEFDRSGKVNNLLSASVNITQGRGISNADNYEEKFNRIIKKY
ncbi:hypothetical protein [Brenneria izbisi]|uniref:Lipoprotein n=1 Tax=Brenneria izbisi TaxID=2939450 RepID=A0AA42C3B6_9GAMM|nr:hypothetical protein [Brenneria izbisi]MCV9880613.1 hypothetical protein [Brenneria izbisi]MCV9884031.1 hypothetical protein [Brenneria izbisi]